jgi:hypothetical protein
VTHEQLVCAALGLGRARARLLAGLVQLCARARRPLLGTMLYLAHRSRHVQLQLGLQRTLCLGHSLLGACFDCVERAQGGGTRRLGRAYLRAKLLPLGLIRGCDLLLPLQALLQPLVVAPELRKFLRELCEFASRGSQLCSGLAQLALRSRRRLRRGLNRRVCPSKLGSHDVCGHVRT